MITLMFTRKVGHRKKTYLIFLYTEDIAVITRPKLVYNKMNCNILDYY